MSADFAEIIARLEKATGPDRNLDADVASAIGWVPAPNYRRCSDNSWRLVIPGHTEHDAINSVTWPPSYTASIDAALTLVPEGEPWTLTRTKRGASSSEVGDIWQYAGATPAIALCIAALRARATLNTAQSPEDRK